MSRILRNDRQPGVSSSPSGAPKGSKWKGKASNAGLFFLPFQFSPSLESLFLREKRGVAFFQPGVVLIGFCLKYLRDGNIRDEPLSLLSGLDR